MNDDDLQHVSPRQHIGRVIFALATTAMVLAGTYFGLRWVFGIA
jgi:hypothetical protein